MFLARAMTCGGEVKSQPRAGAIIPVENLEVTFPIKEKPSVPFTNP
jgi:hypothetical protein